MKNLLISAAVGIIAGTIDIIPMVIKKLDTMFILSAFFMWVAVGILGARTAFTGLAWADGMITAVLVYLPLLFLIVRLDRQALVQITLSTLVLGALTGGLNRILLP